MHSRESSGILRVEQYKRKAFMTWLLHTLQLTLKLLNTLIKPTENLQMPSRESNKKKKKKLHNLERCQPRQHIVVANFLISISFWSYLLKPIDWFLKVSLKYIVNSTLQYLFSACAPWLNISKAPQIQNKQHYSVKGLTKRSQQGLETEKHLKHKHAFAASCILTSQLLHMLLANIIL